ncbi:MAG: chloride channel protein [Promethearchaeota archaeon]
MKGWTFNIFKVLFFPIIFGALCGFMMVLFNFLLILFHFCFTFIPYFISPIIAGALTSLLVKFGKFDRILGTGAAKFVEEIKNPEEYYNRGSNLVAKTFATSWTYGSGMICGKEGPGLLIGANLGYIFSKNFNKFNLNEKDYFFIGASACTGAILKAPISGALFCAELPYNNYMRYKSLLSSIIASIIAYIIFCLFFEFEPLIQTNLSSITAYNINFLTLLPILVFFGMFAGLFVLAFITLLRGFMKKSKNIFRKKMGLYILPLIGAMGYGIFLLLLIPYLNTEYHDMILSPNASFLSFLTNEIENLSWYFLLLLLLSFLMAIFLSIGTLNSAGIIFPLMLLGALIGGFFGVLFYPKNPELFVLLGISAVLGAAINNPITAIIILVEMTWVPFLFIPAGTTIIAYMFCGSNSIISEQRNKKLD